MTNKSDPRLSALLILNEVEEKEIFLDPLMDREYEALSHLNRGLLKELVYGTLRWRGYIDWIIDRHADRKVVKMGEWVRNSLRLGAYQLLFLDKIPPFAAIYESVELVKEKDSLPASGFVNGILRAILRDKEANKIPDLKDDSPRNIAIKYSYPEWLVKRWVARSKIESARQWFKRNIGTPPFTIRVNRVLMDRDRLSNILFDEGISNEKTFYSPAGLILEKPGDITRLHSYQKGLFYIQDEASQLIPFLLSPRPGDLILDACAAPGGKATQLAELIGDRGEVLAIDQSPDRINILQRNLKRLGLTAVKPRQLDLTRDIEEFQQTRFNKILLDAPCSGTGVLRRHPEGKWQKRENNLPSYAKTQYQLLEVVSKGLKPGGIMVYSTCSTEPEENEKVIEKFLKANPAFKIESPRAALPESCHRFIGKDHFLRTYLEPNNMDGFFAVRMAKKG
ncbi:MAG: 16S rRNA (cytosine(967)-C(5))-methyltransferase RsmB [Nitrospirae bacterium]|nr:16S rRNA (cytosine(967)-C(5))-methyltransferase RsmB [Nitrospirota bacterium]